MKAGSGKIWLTAEQTASWLRAYCDNVEQSGQSVRFTYKDIEMCIRVDAFSQAATLNARLPECAVQPKAMSALRGELHPYSINDSGSEVVKTFAVCRGREAEFIVKVEVYRMYYLCEMLSAYCCSYSLSDLSTDTSRYPSLLRRVDALTARDLLAIKVMYLHGFASSGDSGTARQIQKCLPHSIIVSPDLPINQAAALRTIRSEMERGVADIVVGTSMGALLALFSEGRNIIAVNPTLHVSRMMNRRLEGNDAVTLQYYKARTDGATEFKLTRAIADSYTRLEDAVMFHSALDKAQVLGLFGTDDDVVDCREEFTARFPMHRTFEGGHRLSRVAIEEVLIPSMLQMIVNEHLLRGSFHQL